MKGLLHSFSRDMLQMTQQKASLTSLKQLFSNTLTLPPKNPPYKLEVLKTMTPQSVCFPFFYHFTMDALGVIPSIKFWF